MFLLPEFLVELLNDPSNCNPNLKFFKSIVWQLTEQSIEGPFEGPTKRLTERSITDRLFQPAQ